MAVSSWKLNLLRGGGAAARFPPHPPTKGGFLLNHTSRVFLADRLIRRDASFCGLGPILSIFHPPLLLPRRVFCGFRRNAIFDRSSNAHFMAFLIFHVRPRNEFSSKEGVTREYNDLNVGFDYSDISYLLGDLPNVR